MVQNEAGRMARAISGAFTSPARPWVARVGAPEKRKRGKEGTLTSRRLEELVPRDKKGSVATPNRPIGAKGKGVKKGLLPRAAGQT